MFKFRPASLLACAPLLFCPVVAAEPGGVDDSPISEIVVTSQRRPQPLFGHAGNIALLDTEVLRGAGHQHVHELMARVAGVWLTRASGQEHLTAIRSPMLTGPGSCGAFLYLEDGIPVRPAGFCNVNQMLEMATEQASSVEVIRGPGNALYGSNALHGVVNVTMPMPGESRDPYVALEAGANDFLRLRGDLPFDTESKFLVTGLYADDGGFREESGYRQAKLHVKARSNLSGGELITGLTVTDLDQDTAGFILGQDAYRDPDLNRSNLNPEAFRKARSQRLYAIWSRRKANWTTDVRPYLRHSAMDFLQHFLPGKPLEENGHTSAGIASTLRREFAAATVVLGADVEYSDSWLRQTQDGPTEGSAFLQETRPEGQHYDYEVDTFSVAPYAQTEWRITDRLAIHGGVRFEYLQHEYVNHLLDGNTRDDGSECGFGGCLYTRPADRSDDFFNAAPKLALTFDIGRRAMIYANLARGFRAPQATELYRLQSGQDVADLDSVRIDSLEIGARATREKWTADIATYVMTKRNDVLRDAEGFNVSSGRSRHRGIEAKLRFSPSDVLQLSADLSYGKHTYDFDLVAARGETFVSGRDVDTAPRWLANVELRWSPMERLATNLQWTMIGDYFLDAENRFTYPGHEIFNLRLTYRATRSLGIVARLNNVMDDDIADRADYAFGNYRYFPGRGRELFVEIRYTRSESL